MAAIPPTSSQSIALPHPDFEQLVQVVEKMVAASSAHVYRQTFDCWVAWCRANTLSPFDLTPALEAVIMHPTLVAEHLILR